MTSQTLGSDRFVGELPTGTDLLHNPHLNKGTAFTQAERERFGLRGLLPPHVCSEAEQIQRAMENLGRAQTDIDKYNFLASLQDRNETLFYRVLFDNLADLMPIVYTPTVGEACQTFGHIFRRPRGLFVSAEDRGRIGEVLDNWPEKDVGVSVVTDGERILGLGDQGANGMGIPVGKLHLYTACAGIHPHRCLPITLDVGTNRERLLHDPLYIGLRRHRLEGDDYYDFIEEFVTAFHARFPNALLQFEDFANRHAFTLLRKYRDRVCCFNDDIQGTAAVTLAGILASNRITNSPLADQKFLFLGAGEAGIGIADLIVDELVDGGMDEATARAKCWFFDSQGMVCKARSHLAAHKLAYAHEHEWTDDLAAAIKTLKPTMLIGVSGRPQTFTRPVVEGMSEINERPMIFALSNPTSKAECTARQAYTWSGGRAIFASGSPFRPLDVDGKHYVPGQGNNAYVFPGVGLGVLASGASRVTDEMFRAAARSLAEQATSKDLELGCLYPALERILDVSAEIASAVAEVAFARELATGDRPADFAAHVRSQMYDPAYPFYV